MHSALLLLAHPDDESFMLAGTAALLADRGTRVALICATRGQAGSAGTPPLVTPDELPARREAELRAACALVGIDVLRVLDHQDKHLEDADPDALREILVRAIRAERPAVVVTFDPEGVSGHVDHKTIGRRALDAVTAAADARYAPALGRAHRVRRVVWPAPVTPWDEWRPDALRHHWGVDFLVDVRAARQRKIDALRAHATQHGSIDRYWFGDAYERSAGAILDVECFRLGWGDPPPGDRPAADLLAGLEE